MIAVWLVGPPRSVTSATILVASSPAVSAGARSSASSTDGSLGSGTPGSADAGQPCDHPALDVVQVGDPLGHQPAHRVKIPANCSTAAATASASPSPAASRFFTAPRSPLSRARPAVAVSTSAAAPPAAAARAVSCRRP